MAQTQPFDFRSDLPAAPAGKVNVIWQADDPSTDPTILRKVSAYVDLSGSGDVVVHLSANHTLATAENVAFCTGTFTVTLPVSPSLASIYTVNIAGGTVTIAPSSGNINGQSSVTGTDGYSFELRFDGANWRIV